MILAELGVKRFHGEVWTGGASTSWQRTRPAWGEAEAGRCRQNRCQDQRRV